MDQRPGGSSGDPILICPVGKSMLQSRCPRTNFWSDYRCVLSHDPVEPVSTSSPSTTTPPRKWGRIMGVRMATATGTTLQPRALRL